MILIGVLVAVSIPIFTAQLKKAKHATDLANGRALYAALVADYLDDSTYSDTSIAGTKTASTAVKYGTDLSFKISDIGGMVITLGDNPSVKVTCTETGTGFEDQTFGETSSTTSETGVTG